MKLRDDELMGFAGLWHKTQPFVNGSIAASVALLAVQPFDVAKMRYQLGSKLGFAQLARKIVREEGAKGLYKGLDAGLARQMTYGMTRLGVFRTLSDLAKRRRQEKNRVGSDGCEDAAAAAQSVQLPLWEKGVCALAAGAIGAIVGNPADLAVVRLTADGALPQALRKNYKGVFDCLSRTVKSEGVVGLWRGTGMTVTRCMAVNLGQLASADQARDILENMGAKKGGFVSILGGSVVGGFVGAFFSMPFDYVKSQVQSMQVNAVTGKFPYKGAMDCARKTLGRHGPLRFYAGFMPYFLRQAPHAILTLCLLAELTIIEDHLEDDLEREMHKPKLHKAKRALFPK
ncbi:mitochondrial substrate carrier protein [Chloropicon primus]|uniref:Mitochondrial substrate carrier protein n=1 Tax=Chloropicon primus TaxID=1764295 RepID=A0A5B8N1L0_9CHLO|nr:mitochondrial substrate carrier protein [Chloropicon primus]UPR05213.1 mitochondrial substrate carrier protein [Chloropicon primus]|mmetsp:Transcript_2806/g.7690  ORF Transcript_2806/g.7690 Transcript_2806/m.7690 type:complete len:344 (-) Transcript_2806:161-1192(-)|eukprot:QDZ26012.1 mitochondrial substrate carrier protein [Chloropicon primus]